MRGHLSAGAEVEAAMLLVATGQAPSWADVGLGAVGIGDDPEVDDDYRVAGRDWLRAIRYLNARPPWTNGPNNEAGRLAPLPPGDDPGPNTEPVARCVFQPPPRRKG